MDALMEACWRSPICSDAPTPPDSGGSSISPRQQSVLELLLKGMGRSGIAAELELSPHTVGDHIKEIYRAFEVHSQAELLGRFVGDSGRGGGRLSE